MFRIHPRSILNVDSHRFYNGGILFSSITLAFIAFISLYSFVLLVKTKFVVSGSFGGKIYDSINGVFKILTMVPSRLSP